MLQDELLRGNDYAPSRVAGSQIRLEKVHAQQSEILIEKFFSDQGETKGAFNKKIHMALSNTSTSETYVVKDITSNELGFVSYSKQVDNQITVLFLRVGKAQICQYVAKYLVNEIVLAASSEKKSTVLIKDQYLSKTVIAALQENGFLKVADSWVKLTLPKILDIQDTIKQLLDTSWPDYTKKLTTGLVSALKDKPNKSILLGIEKGLALEN